MRKKQHPLYNRWLRMRARCNNPNTNDYCRYGARGISVCSRWDDFWLFLEDMGECPEGYTIDRINPIGDYEPSNCRWASPSEQVINRQIYSQPMVADNPMRYITKHHNRWRVQMSLLGKNHAVTFATLDEAIAYRSDLEFEREMHRRLGLTYKRYP